MNLDILTTIVLLVMLYGTTVFVNKYARCNTKSSVADNLKKEDQKEIHKLPNDMVDLSGGMFGI